MTYDSRPVCLGLILDVFHNVAVVTQRGDESRRWPKIVRDPKER